MQSSFSIKMSRRITLSICDDGQSFEKEQVEGGHLGLQIMVERAESIGADLTIASHPGKVRKLASPGLALEVKTRIWSGREIRRNRFGALG